MRPCVINLGISLEWAALNYYFFNRTSLYPSIHSAPSLPQPAVESQTAHLSFMCLLFDAERAVCIRFIREEFSENSCLLLLKMKSMKPEFGGQNQNNEAKSLAALWGVANEGDYCPWVYYLRWLLLSLCVLHAVSVIVVTQNKLKPKSTTYCNSRIIVPHSLTDKNGSLFYGATSKCPGYLLVIWLDLN